MQEMKEKIWTSSNSPYAPITRVRTPEGIVLPAAGVWQRVKAAGETVYTLDTSQSVDGWLAWMVFGRLLRCRPDNGMKAIEEMAGNQYDFWIGYVRPSTAASFGVGYKRRQRMNVVIVGPGERRPATADDFAEPEVLLP